MARIAVIGGIVVDIAVQTPRLPMLRETLLAEAYKVGPGGKAANAAVAVARSGGEAILVGCIGDDDFGRMELAFLRREGVETGHVVVHAGDCTGMGIAMIGPDGENTIVGVLGANDGLQVEDLARAVHRQRLDAVLVNFEAPEAVVAAAVGLGKEQGVPVVVDTGPARPYAPEGWSDCAVLAPNEQEAATLAGCPIEDDATAEQAARTLLALGPEAVALHQGRRGALLVTAHETVRVASFPVPVVDTTGAGDAFSGTLTVALAEGLTLTQALLRANAAGALAVTRLGTLPAMPTRREIDALLARAGGSIKAESRPR
jgi:ribokinase